MNFRDTYVNSTENFVEILNILAIKLFSGKEIVLHNFIREINPRCVELPYFYSRHDFRVD